MIIAITGTIGAGKSSVAHFFKEKGYPVFDADKMVHEYYNKGEVIYNWLVQTFGPKVLHDDETLNRQALAKLVFSNPKELENLESVIFPKVKADIMAIKKKANQKLIFIEVPLLFEAEMDQLFDCIITVDAPVKIRHMRLAKKGLQQTDIDAREKRQLPSHQKRALAHIIIDNDQDLESLYSLLIPIERRLLHESSN